MRERFPQAPPARSEGKIFVLTGTASWRTSEARGVPDHESTRSASGGLPAGARFAAGSARIEAQAGDRHEDVTVADVERDPVPFAFFAVLKIIFRSE